MNHGRKQSACCIEDGQSLGDVLMDGILGIVTYREHYRLLSFE